jgi:hypothetical protein
LNLCYHDINLRYGDRIYEQFDTVIVLTNSLNVWARHKIGLGSSFNLWSQCSREWGVYSLTWRKGDLQRQSIGELVYETENSALKSQSGHLPLDGRILLSVLTRSSQKVRIWSYSLVLIICREFGWKHCRSFHAFSV